MQLPIHRNHQNSSNDSSIMSFRNALDSFFDDNFWNNWDIMRMPMLSHPSGWLPKVDISETDKEIRLKINTPGVDPKQINISVEDNILSISGKTEKENEEEGENFYRMERESGSFQRSLKLPNGVDTEKIEANSANGVVTITIPKKPESQRKPITIKVNEK